MTNDLLSCFVDTNVLIYLKDNRATAKRELALRWLRVLAEREALVISPQSINEFCSVILSKFRHVPPAELAETVQLFSLWCRAETRYENALGALRLRKQMLVSFYDAVLIDSALTAGCGYFLSEDLQHDRLIDGMRIINPFQIDPEVILAN